MMHHARGPLGPAPPPSPLYQIFPNGSSRKTAPFTLFTSCRLHLFILYYVIHACTKSGGSSPNGHLDLGLFNINSHLDVIYKAHKKTKSHLLVMKNEKKLLIIFSISNYKTIFYFIFFIIYGLGT